MNRRKFLILSGGTLLSGCKFGNGDAGWPYLRFAVVSDGHYGEPGADFNGDYQSMVSSLNAYHHDNPINFLMVNGDLSHDNPDYVHEAKAHLDTLKMPYKVSKGNHDRMDEMSWDALWGHPFDYSFSVGDDAFITLNTSDLAGDYLCPDYTKLEQMLHEHQGKKNIFMFMHINPVSQTKFAVECNQFLSLVKSYPNTRAVFNGHDHDHDDIIIGGNVPFVFDGHFGGTWGTNDKGFRVVECYNSGAIVTFMMSPSIKKNETALS